jgi:hypothetical protein
MKKIITILLVFCAFVIKAQNDYTGNIIKVKNSVSSTDPRGKLFLVEANEDTLYLPAPASVSGKVIAIIANGYTLYTRLNQNVTYRWNNTTGFTTLNYIGKSTATVYLYSNGTDYEYYYYYIPTAIQPLVTAINSTDATTHIQKSLPYTITASDFGKTINLSSGAEFLNLPDPASIPTQKSFKIVNQGSRLLQLNYPFTVDGSGAMTRTSVTHTEGGNMWEIIAEGGKYKAISNH